MPWRLLPTFLGVFVALVSSGAVVFGVPEQSRPIAGTSLRIVVIEGEAAINVVQQKTAVAPVIEVRDRNDQPVAGAIVKFAITKGRASFSGAHAMSVTTNAAGRAIATGLTPTGTGAIQIAASTAFQGETAAVSILQTNVMTAAQAATASSAAGTAGGSSSGSLSNVAVASIAGGAGAGALTIATLLQGNPPAIVSSVSGMGIRDVTEFAFSDSGDGAASATWDFGDGTTATGKDVTHTYHAEGTFLVKVHEGESSATLEVSIGNLNGTWQRPAVDQITHRLVITQQGASLTGQFIVDVLPGSASGGSPGTMSSTLAGTLTSPRGITLAESGGCRRNITVGTVDGTLKVIDGPQGFYGNAACGGPFNATGAFAYFRN